ncbi:hypothetical protein QF001_003752 [Paraburkholderia youngii]|uniref:hypothetical protein n=1 Tax=Paraburkholderia youngii TaxID=2782701 RepID=UPI003D1F7D22
MDEIDEILLQWYRYELAYRPVAGYAGGSCNEYRTSRQWMTDDEYDAEVTLAVDQLAALVVAPLVAALDIRLRIAVTTAVRNLYAGYTVWLNPQYPATQASDYSTAKRLLRPRLVMAGLLDR